MNEQHDAGNRQLALDDGIFVLNLKQCRRHDVEVCCHRSAQGSAIAGRQTKSTDDNRVCTLHDQEWNADANRDDGESSKAVAHDDGEQSHRNAVNRTGNELASIRNDCADAIGDHGTDTCCGKQSAQSRQELRQNADRSDIIHETGSVDHGIFRVCLEETKRNDQSNRAGKTNRIVCGNPGQSLNRAAQSSSYDSNKCQAQSRDKDLIAKFIGRLTNSLGIRNIVCALLDTVNTGENSNNNDAKSGDPLRQEVAANERESKNEPERSCGFFLLCIRIAQGLNANQRKDDTNNCMMPGSKGKKLV